MKKFFEDNSLSIALFSLFVICLVAQAIVGFFSYADTLKQAHLASVSFAGYLGTGTFLDGVFSNWQAAILQLTVLISFSSVLRQRGAAHSRKPNDEKAQKGAPEKKGETGKEGRPPIGRLRNLSNLYRNSLSLVFLAFFVVLFVLHSIFGWMFYNEDQAIAHLSATSYAGYVASSSFWFSVFQTWEAEFFAIGFYIVASIFLRQENSPESKTAEATDDDTGDTNE